MPTRAENEIRPITLGRKNYVFCGKYESVGRQYVRHPVIVGQMPQPRHQLSLLRSMSELRVRTFPNRMIPDTRFFFSSFTSVVASKYEKNI